MNFKKYASTILKNTRKIYSKNYFYFYICFLKSSTTRLDEDVEELTLMGNREPLSFGIERILSQNDSQSVSQNTMLLCGDNTPQQNLKKNRPIRPIPIYPPGYDPKKFTYRTNYEVSDSFNYDSSFKQLTSNAYTNPDLYAYNYHYTNQLNFNYRNSSILRPIPTYATSLSTISPEKKGSNEVDVKSERNQAIEIINLESSSSESTTTNGIGEDCRDANINLHQDSLEASQGVKRKKNSYGFIANKHSNTELKITQNNDKILEDNIGSIELNEKQQTDNFKEMFDDFNASVPFDIKLCGHFGINTKTCENNSQKESEVSCANQKIITQEIIQNLDYASPEFSNNQVSKIKIDCLTLDKVETNEQVETNKHVETNGHVETEKNLDLQENVNNSVNKANFRLENNFLSNYNGVYELDNQKLGSEKSIQPKCYENTKTFDEIVQIEEILVLDNDSELIEKAFDAVDETKTNPLEVEENEFFKEKTKEISLENDCPQLSKIPLSNSFHSQFKNFLKNRDTFEFNRNNGDKNPATFYSKHFSLVSYSLQKSNFLGKHIFPETINLRCTNETMVFIEKLRTNLVTYELDITKNESDYIAFIFFKCCLIPQFNNYYYSKYTFFKFSKLSKVIQLIEFEKSYQNLRSFIINPSGYKFEDSTFIAKHHISKIIFLILYSSEKKTKNVEYSICSSDKTRAQGVMDPNLCDKKIQNFDFKFFELYSHNRIKYLAQIQEKKQSLQQTAKMLLNYYCSLFYIRKKGYLVETKPQIIELIKLMPELHFFYAWKFSILEKNLENRRLRRDYFDMSFNHLHHLIKSVYEYNEKQDLNPVKCIIITYREFIFMFLKNIQPKSLCCCIYDYCLKKMKCSDVNEEDFLIESQLLYFLAFTFQSISLTEEQTSIIMSSSMESNNSQLLKLLIDKNIIPKEEIFGRLQSMTDIMSRIMGLNTSYELINYPILWYEEENIQFIFYNEKEAKMDVFSLTINQALKFFYIKNMKFLEN